MVNPNAQKAIDWYIINRPLYQSLAKKVESVLEEILDFNNIIYHNIDSRAKPIDSYSEKASLEKYRDPISEIKDMAGIRVITYIDSVAKNVTKIVEETFKIIPEHSGDKTEELGVDRVGYRSIYCVGTLGKDRLKLPENKKFKDLCFEIQVRTILQHAWAEFEHDRNYKFSGVLPKKMRRKLSILAGTVEFIEMVFDDISKEIDDYTMEVGKKTEAGDLSIPINSTSLREYMTKKYKPLIEKGVAPTLVYDEKIIHELFDMGINTLEKLDNITPKDFIEKKSKYLVSTSNFLGILTNILVIYNAEVYFKKAWKNRWNALHRINYNMLKDYGIDIDKYLKLYGIDVN